MGDEMTNNNDSNKKPQIIKTVCSSCYCGCGVLAHVKDGRVVHLEGDVDHPTSRGHLCMKGLSGIELLYHPDRLNYPLKRKGKKGEGKWERISWQEALETISVKLNEIIEVYGPEAICVGTGAGLYSNMGMLGYFCYLLGTPNLLSSAYICFMPTAAATYATIGYPAAMLATEIVNDEVLNSNCILLWAANPKNTVPYPMGFGILGAKKRGTPLIVVDPRPTETAKAADVWLKIRPGTDDALALGFTHVIIKENLYDHDFVENYAYGFKELTAHIEQYSPEAVSRITWIPKEDIVKAARLFASSRPSCLCQRVPIDQNLNAVQTSRAMLIFNALCGNLDMQGGNLLPANSDIIGEYPIMSKLGQLPRETLSKRIGAEELPFHSGPDAVFGFVHPTFWRKAVLEEKPYPVKAVITSGRNQILGDQDVKMIEKAYRKLGFAVTMELFMTPMAELSDIVLPAASWLEKEGFRGHMGYPYVIPVQHKVVDPLFERKEDNAFFIALAHQMKLDIPWKNLDEYHNFRLKSRGISFESLRGTNSISMVKQYDRHKTGEFKFNTPSGKFEIYSTVLEKLGFDPLPGYLPPPETTPEFPLILMGGTKRSEFVHSAGRQIRSLRQNRPDPIIELNPELAKEKGIREGDWIWIESIHYGEKERVKFKARLLEELHPQIVSVEHGWWIPEEKDQQKRWYESNINVILTGNEYDPVFGSTNLRSVPCRIYKA